MLKNFNLVLPLNRLIVITGLSGSGKSSLAFDTLFAEGQRRYIETFSPYARQFFDRMDKPQGGQHRGHSRPRSPSSSRNSVKTTRSTVGTMTEICDYMKLVPGRKSPSSIAGNAAGPVKKILPARFGTRSREHFSRTNGAENIKSRNLRPAARGTEPGIEPTIPGV